MNDEFEQEATEETERPLVSRFSLLPPVRFYSSFIVHNSSFNRFRHSSTMILVVVAPTRVSPGVRTANRGSKVLLPLDALICTCGVQHRRMSRKSPSTAATVP